MDRQLNTRITSLLEEADQAADARTNGLLDREEFLVLVRKLLIVTRELMGVYDQVEYQRNELAQHFLEQYRKVERSQAHPGVNDTIANSPAPAEVPLIPSLDIAAYHCASHRTESDYYDFFPLIDGNWGILIAHVSGQGLPAALVREIARNVAHSSPATCSPQDLLSEINRRIAQGYSASGTFVTAFCAIYHPSDRTLSYARAGHPHPRLHRASSPMVEEMRDPDGLPLGINPDEHYESRMLRLAPGDLLAMYTDGIVEARAADHQKFEVERLDAVLAHAYPTADAAAAAIMSAVHRFTADEPLEEDQTLVVLQARHDFRDGEDEVCAADDDRQTSGA